jgi:hypothetical protein
MSLGRQPSERLGWAGSAKSAHCRAGCSAGPSCLISCSQDAPEGGYGADVETHGAMKPAGRALGRDSIARPIGPRLRESNPQARPRPTTNFYGRQQHVASQDFLGVRPDALARPIRPLIFGLAWSVLNGAD